MRLFTAILFVLFSMVLPAAEQVQVGDVRLWQSAEKLRLVFDVSAPLEYDLFRLSDPERLVVDLSNARIAPRQPSLSAEGWFKQIRTASRNGGDLRLVLDLERPVSPASFILKPDRKRGHRLVIDLFANTAAPAGDSFASVKPGSAPREGRDIVVAIDAGHGGEDPGAIGKGKTREKEVVLAIARKLQGLVDREPGMRAVMIREGDYYIGLRDRIKKARQHKADLFISIHADSFKRSSARGSSVFTLSAHGATSEAARWLAEKENAADLIGGVSLDDKDDILASVLLDLSQTATIEASTTVAAKVLDQLGKVNELHKRHVEQAGFAVLKSPDIPSILVETAFISNPSEERKLNNKAHQKKLARAILSGVRAYFLKYPPPGTALALRSAGERYVIQQGDTLSTIARRYRVRMDDIRQTNGLESDLLRVGDVLLIPGTLGG